MSTTKYIVCANDLILPNVSDFFVVTDGVNTINRISTKLGVTNENGIFVPSHKIPNGFKIDLQFEVATVLKNSYTTSEKFKPIRTHTGSDYTTGINEIVSLVYSLSDEWFISSVSKVASAGVPTSRNLTINGVTQDLSADRTWTISASSTITDITHANLLTAIAGSTLNKGNLYRITDHATKHLIPYTSTVRTASVEKLVVLATDVNKIDKQAYSQDFPQDVIYYDVNDVSCEDGTWDSTLQRYTGGTARKGKITYRKDTQRNLETWFDWRNVKFRCWAVDAELWVTGTTYAANTFVKSTIDAELYFTSGGVINSVVDPKNDGGNFQLIFEITKNKYISPYKTSNEFNAAIPGWTGLDTLIINNSIPVTDYQDFYCFAFLDDLTRNTGIDDLGGGFKNISLPKTDHDYILDLYSVNNIDYPNTVFFINNSSILNLYKNNLIFTLGIMFDNRFIDVDLYDFGFSGDFNQCIMINPNSNVNFGWNEPTYSNRIVI